MEEMVKQNLTMLQYMVSPDFTYFGLMELLMEGGEASGVEEKTGNNALHLLYGHTVKPAELYVTTKLLVENGCQVDIKNSKGVSPIELLILHVNRGLIHHKPRLPELRRMEDFNEKQAEIDLSAAEFDAEYQKQVQLCINYILNKGVDCDIIASEVPSIPHDKIWSEAFEHKIMQQEGRWTLLKFGTGMIYSKYNIFNPLTKNRVKNSCGLSLIHLVAWRGSYECLKEVLQFCKDPCVVSADGRNALHLLFHYCNRPLDLVACTKLLLETGLNPNQADQNGQTPLSILLKHTFVKKSYIKFLANSYEKSILRLGACDDWLVDEVLQCLHLLLQAGVHCDSVDLHGNTTLHVVFQQLQQVLHNCDVGFQEMGHTMVPYRFSIRPATQVISVLLTAGVKVNTVNGDGDTALHLLCKCMERMCLRHTVNTIQDIQDCFQQFISKGAHLNIKNKKGGVALMYLPVEPDVIHSTGGQILHYIKPIINMFADNGADLNAMDNGGRTFLHRFLSLRYGGDGGFLEWSRFRFLKGAMARGYQTFIQLLMSRGADPSLPFVYGMKQNYLLNAIYSAHRCRMAPEVASQICDVDTVNNILQLFTHNMTQSSVQTAMCFFYTTCQIIPPDQVTSKYGPDAPATPDYTAAGCQLVKHHDNCFGNKATLPGSQHLVYENSDLGVPYSPLSLHGLTHDCDICRGLLLTVTQPRRLKHHCRLVVLRALGNQFATQHRKLPLPPSLHDYVGDLMAT